MQQYRAVLESLANVAVRMWFWVKSHEWLMGERLAACVCCCW